jgi:hypothetical protein
MSAKQQRHLFFASVASRSRYAVVADLGKVVTSGWLVLDFSEFYEHQRIKIVGEYLGGSHKMRRAMMRTAKRQQESADGDTEAMRGHRMQRIEGDRKFNQAILKGLRKTLARCGVKDDPRRVAPPVVIVGDSGRGQSGMQSGAASLFDFLGTELFVCKAAEHKSTGACCACGRETEHVPCVGQKYASRSRRCKVGPNGELCPLFKGKRRGYTGPGGTSHEPQTINRAFHRDLAAGLGIFVHWACHALDIDLPEHFMTSSQLQAKKDRDSKAAAKQSSSSSAKNIAGQAL